jgi:GNAT superfamily N-acetyltransferase
MIDVVKAGAETDQALVNGFVEAYQEAFSGPPYYESYGQEEVLNDIWTPHLSSGVIVMAVDEAKVVGFGCALPVESAPDDVRDYVSESAKDADLLGLGIDSSWYMSELGVIESHRLKGIGYELVRQRLLEIKNSGVNTYIFRTAAEGSNSMHLYQKLGANILAGVQDMTDSEQVLSNGSQSAKRVYLYGDCDTALSKIPVLNQ